MPIPTKEKLAQALHALGLFDLEREARAGEFDDYENTKYAAPKVVLCQLLFESIAAVPPPDIAPLVLKLIGEVQNGKWDNTREEGEAWFAREGKDLLHGKE